MTSDSDPIARLENLYRQGNAWTKEDQSNLNEAREELVKLQNGDPENLQPLGKNQRNQHGFLSFNL